MSLGKDDARKERESKGNAMEKRGGNTPLSPGEPASTAGKKASPSMETDRPANPAPFQKTVVETGGPEEWDVLGRREFPASGNDGEEESAAPGEAATRPSRLGRSGKRRKKSQPGGARGFRDLVSFRIPVYWSVGLVVLIAILTVGPVFQWGTAVGKKRADDEALRERLSMPPEIAAKIDDALLTLRSGDSASALAVLQAIEAEKGFYPSLSYLVALAAVQSGDVKLAERKIEETIVKRERVSDALALQAVVETMKRADPARTVMGDPKVRSENFLRQAILADPANAAPRFELATLLRYTNRRDEARKEIRAAQARLNPVDVHTVTDVTLALMDLEDTPDDRLPTNLGSPRNLAEALVAANISLRRGDFTVAVEMLKAGRDMTDPDIFYYLTSDPVFRRYRDRPELAGLLQ